MFNKPAKCGIFVCLGSLCFLIFCLNRVYENEYSLDSTQSMMAHNLSTCTQSLEEYQLIVNFSYLMRSVNVEVVLLEPTILHCLLNSYEKDLLSRRNFNISRPVPGTLNFGIIGTRTSNLLKTHNFSKQGFHLKLSVEEKKWPSWWLTPKVNSHLFFHKDRWMIHVVIFQKRDTYLWHSALNSNQLSMSFNGSDGSFTQYDSAYEMFHPVSLAEVEVMIPSNPSLFLHQISSSRIVPCLGKQVDDRHRNGRYQLLKMAFLNSLMELKIQLQPFHITVVLFGGTLLGWFRECDLMSYTSDVDFAAFVADVEGEHFWVKTFRDNDRLKINTIMGFPDEGYELKFLSNHFGIDLFFLYENGSNFWSSGHRPSKGYYFRYTYPKFELCSADLLGHKVHVPCTPEQVVSAEYGTNWSIPVQEWNYESSPFNTGPKIYWTSDKKVKAYQFF